LAERANYFAHLQQPSSQAAKQPSSQAAKQPSSQAAKQPSKGAVRFDETTTMFYSIAHKKAQTRAANTVCIVGDKLEPQRKTPPQRTGFSLKGDSNSPTCDT
jgi:hypothetical protein